MTPSLPPLSIVHALAPARIGGLETVVVALTAGLTRAGERVCVAPILPQEANGAHPVVQALEEAGVDVAPIRVGGRQYLAERRRLRDILRDRDAAILHTHGYRPDVVDAPVARRLGVGTVTTVHGYTVGGWRNQLYQRLQTRAFRGFDAVIPVSEKLSGELAASGVGRERLHTVRNAWYSNGPKASREDARRRLSLPCEPRVVGWVGRMTPEKGPDVMIRAAAAFADGSTRICMIGSGPAEARSRELAAALGIDDRVHWAGLVPDAGALLAAFDAFVISSWTEGTPMVLLEAMAAGVPIVSTAVGGIPDVISEREAVLCAAGDAAGIAAAVDGVLADPLAAARRAEAASARLASDFAVEAWVERHRQIYHAVRRG